MCSSSYVSTLSLYPEEEDALRECLGFSMGEWGAIPHAGGGEGLYIASHHTGLLFTTVHYTPNTMQVH